MSDNKFKYYTVEKVQTFTVRANSKTDATKLVQGKKNIPGTVLGSSGELRIERIPASQAHGSLAASA